MSSIFQKLPFNYVYQVGIANLLDISADTVQLNGIQTNTVFETIDLPANTLVADGQRLIVELYGITNNPNANTTIRGRIVSNIFTVAIRGLAPSQRFMFRVHFLRRGSTLIEIFTEIIFDIPNGTAPAIVTPECNHMLFGLMNGIDFATLMQITFDVTMTNAGDSFLLTNTHVKVE